MALSQTPNSFHLNHTLINSFAPDPDAEPAYVFSSLSNGHHLAVAASNNIIKVYDPSSFAIKGQLEGHTDTIQEIQWANTHPDMLYSCSSDATMRVWDVRDKKPGPVYRGDGEIFCLSSNKDDSLLAAGVKNNIKLWDVRSTKQVMNYPDFHSEEVTQVKFHDQLTTQLYTGSVDGTICIFDVTQTDEDEALIGGMNPEDSVSKLYFFGPQSEYVACTTGSERFLIFNLEGDKVHDFGDQRANLSTEATPINYLITCTYDTTSQQLYLITGGYEGFIGIVHVMRDQLKMVSSLPGGHSGVVRSFQWDTKSHSIITGGEDSRICFWSTQMKTPTTSESGLGKVLKTGSKTKNTPPKQNQSHTKK